MEENFAEYKLVNGMLVPRDDNDDLFEDKNDSVFDMEIEKSDGIDSFPFKGEIPKKDEKKGPVSTESVFKNPSLMKQAEKKENQKIDSSEQIFKNPIAFNASKGSEKKKSEKTGDPFDEMFVALDNYDKMGKRKVTGVSDMDTVSMEDVARIINEYREEAKELGVDLSSDTYVGNDTDYMDMDLFNGTSSYQQMKDNSTGSYDNKRNHDYSIVKRIKNVALGTLLTVAVVFTVGKVASEISNMVKDFQSDVITNAYGLETLESYSHYNYQDVFTMESDNVKDHIVAAVEFFDNMKDYPQQYRMLSIYQTYTNVKSQTRLDDMDRFLYQLKAYSKDKSHLYNYIIGYDCFLEYALHVVEQAEGKEITEYDSVIDKYMTVNSENDDKDKTPYELLNSFEQNSIQELMQRYRDCSDKLYEELIDMERNERHVRK